MAADLDPNGVYIPSDKIVAREIEGDTIMIPLVAGVGHADDDLYTLNETGQAIWHRMDGERTLSDIVEALAAEFGASREDLEKDVFGFTRELVQLGILIQKS